MRCMTCHNIATVRDRWKCIPSVVGAVPRLEVGISKTLRKRFARNFLSYGLVPPFPVSRAPFLKLEALRVFVYHYFRLTENLFQKICFQDFDKHLWTALQKAADFPGRIPSKSAALFLQF